MDGFRCFLFKVLSIIFYRLLVIHVLEIQLLALGNFVGLEAFSGSGVAAKSAF